MIFPVILCGGTGSRLWPASRETHPKPFIRLSDNQSLLQKTFLRVKDLGDVSEITLVTNRVHFFDIKDHIGEVNSENLEYSIISEPQAKDTAAAVACAALAIEKKYGPDATLLVTPSDQIITHENAFKAAVNEAYTLAQEGNIVTFGIEPTNPATGYGYIHAEGTRVKCFIEKPDLETAKSLLREGNYLWNSGMFCFKAKTLIEEMKLLCPNILEQVSACLESSCTTVNNSFSHLEINSGSYSEIEKISFDFSVMEKTTKAAVVACNLGWSDIGDWRAFSQLSAVDESNNAAPDDAILIDTKDCYIRGNNRLVATIGLENLVIIDEQDVLLVADKDKSQSVKKVYEHLKDNADDRYKIHSKVHRPWGTYTVIQEMPGFKVKHLEVKPGAQLSLQMHHHRSEHWIVVSGMAKVVNGDRELYLSVSESTYIPASHFHRLENPGLIPLIIVEVQCGEYLGEDDIVRVEDAYAR